jgi:hypothetical protein
MPYRDAFDFKPPGIYVVYAIARVLFGPAQVGIRALEVLGLAGMVAAMIRLADRWWGEPKIGWIAGALAVLAHAQLDFWHTAQPESFGGMLTIAALLVATRGTPLAIAGAGAIFGVTGLLKPPLAGGGVVLAAALAVRAWRETSGDTRARFVAAARPVWLVALGGVAPVALCLLWFFARGALHDLYEVLFVFTPYYTKLSWVGESVAGMAYWGFTEWLVAYSAPLSVGVLTLLPQRLEPREREGVAILGGIIAMHLVGVVMQGKFFPYHYAATWPVTAMLAGLGVHKIWKRLARRGAIGVAVFFAGFVAVALCRTATKDTPDSFRERCEKRIALFTARVRDQDAIDALASVADVNAAENRHVAEWLSSHVPPGRPVFVFGFEPVIYDLADRPPATRYLYDVPQRVAWAAPAMRASLMDDLARRPPAAIVVERRDVFPMVTGEAIDSADVLRTSFVALRDLLAARYEHAATIGDFEIYQAR